MRVSIVVPAFNEELDLPACLAAIARQDYTGPIETIVVDNASTDRTGDVARRFGVTVVHEPTRGYCDALRRGFGVAQGDVIACTDADTEVPPDWISTLVREYEARPDVVAIGGGIEFVEPNWKCRLVTDVAVPLFNRLDFANPAGPHLWGANMSVRRDAFLAAGGWNPRFSLQADSELSERLRGFGRVIVLERLRVRTSSRRWNRAPAKNVFIYVSNWVWFQVLGFPLFHDFPVVRETAASRAAAARPRWALGAAALALFVVGLVTYQALTPFSNAFGRTFQNGHTREKVVALTFDDGPNEPYTSQVLDVLAREHVRATFFLIGANVRVYPAAAAKIASAGHVIGNHSDSHPVRFALEPVASLAQELDTAERTIHAATGVYPHFFRPPQGLRSPWLMQVLERDSLIAVTWDDAPRDWDPAPPQTLVERTLAQVHPGSIVLLHDGMNLQHGADQSATVKALPAIIHGLRARGYRFVTLPEMLGGTPTLASWSGGAPTPALARGASSPSAPTAASPAPPAPPAHRARS